MQIKSSLITLEEVVEKELFFNIPIYQRLYVWKEEQIKTLLEDVETAYSEGKELFYLGGILAVENKAMEDGRAKVYDLVDGQQRFITLWMIAMVLGGAMKPFVRSNKRHRITFAIREDICRFFRAYIDGAENGSATSNIENALALISKYRDQFDMEKPQKSLEIAEFIYSKVRVVFTEVPKETDLNKLFETINNRGVQLQHHEILKAQIMNKVPSEDRMKYSHIWDACSYMDSYVEKNIRDIANIKIQDLFDNESSQSGGEKLADPKAVLNAIQKRQDDSFEPLSLSAILNSEKEEYKQKKDLETYEYEADSARSIVTFPMLLQHALRIFLVRRNEDDIPKILDKELLYIFSNSFFAKGRTPDEIKEFIELLWEVRYLFDKHVIKWVQQEDGESHLICKLSRYKSGAKPFYLRRVRPKSNEGEALLQSMLYHSQQITTQYWLTPYLKYLLDHNGQNGYEYLRKVDNYLNCSVELDSLAQRTRRFLEDEGYRSELSTEILDEPLGTGFPHYWFYKLEYILWEKLSQEKDDRWKSFKFTAKNSVEHISPQNQKSTDTNVVSAKILNSFGNLSLVSRSVNSEYSNLPFNEKRQRFKNNNRVRLDSLKMDLIYESDVWNDGKAEEHQNEMIKIFNEYLGIK